VDPLVQHRQQQLDRLAPHARRAGGKRVRPQQHRRTHHLGRERLTHRTGVAAKQVQLQPAGVLTRDRDIDEPAESRVDAVRGRARLDRPLDQGTRGIDLLQRLRTQTRRRARDRHPLDIVDREV
jgi:hypothetical protein